MIGASGSALPANAQELVPCCMFILLAATRIGKGGVGIMHSAPFMAIIALFLSVHLWATARQRRDRQRLLSAP